MREIVCSVLEQSNHRNECFRKLKTTHCFNRSNSVNNLSCLCSFENDTYNNLTLKTLAAFDWMLTFCPQAEYLLKTDDDMFIQVKG